MNNIDQEKKDKASLLLGIRQKPSLYLGDGSERFWNLVAFILGFQIGNSSGTGIIPDGFDDFVRSRLYCDDSESNKGWIDMILDNFPEQDSSYQVLLMLLLEYYRV